MQRYDGGYGQTPHLEPQGGSTYCVIAAMSLVHGLGDNLPAYELEETIGWLASRQTEYVPESDDEDTDDAEDADADDTATEEQHIQGPVAGFQGRPGKDPDACYSFWCSAALSVRLSRSLCPALD